MKNEILYNTGAHGKCIEGFYSLMGGVRCLTAKFEISEGDGGVETLPDLSAYQYAPGLLQELKRPRKTPLFSFFLKEKLRSLRENWIASDPTGWDYYTACETFEPHKIKKAGISNPSG